MAAASAMKLVATVCVAMLLVVQSSLGYQPPALPAPGGGAGGLACPSSDNECRETCKRTCDALSLAVCQTICTVPITPVGSTCVNEVLAACFARCLTNCQIALDY